MESSPIIADGFDVAVDTRAYDGIFPDLPGVALLRKHPPCWLKLHASLNICGRPLANIRQRSVDVGQVLLVVDLVGVVADEELELRTRLVELPGEVRG